jgi:hypothetical protein
LGGFELFELLGKGGSIGVIGVIREIGVLRALGELGVLRNLGFCQQPPAKL